MRPDMIPKAKLCVGDYYAGTHRSASVARWTGSKFRYWTIVENLNYSVEEAFHPEDDDGFALFTPLVRVQHSGLVPVPLGDEGLSHLALMQRAVFFAEREAWRHERTLFWLVRACDLIGQADHEVVGPEARAGFLKRVDRLWDELGVNDVEMEAIRSRGEPARHSSRVAVIGGTGVIVGDERERREPMASKDPAEAASQVLGSHVIRLINERERLLYWICRAWHEAGANEALALKLHNVLVDFGYDADRVIRMLELGEPTAGRR